jgi:hypothetical protein
MRSTKIYTNLKMYIQFYGSATSRVESRTSSRLTFLPGLTLNHIVHTPSIPNTNTHTMTTGSFKCTTVQVTTRPPPLSSFRSCYSLRYWRMAYTTVILLWLGLWLAVETIAVVHASPQLDQNQHEPASTRQQQRQRQRRTSSLRLKRRDNALLVRALWSHNYFARSNGTAIVESTTTATSDEESLILLEQGSSSSGSGNIDFSFSMHSTMVPTSSGSAEAPVDFAPTVDDLTSLVTAWLAALTDSTLLNDANTPQGQAFLYIASLLQSNATTTSTLLSSFGSKSQAQQRVLTHYALATLYYSTRGNNWTNSMGWLKFDEECEWAMVVCDHENDDAGSSNTDGSLVVTKLLLGT